MNALRTPARRSPLRRLLQVAVTVFWSAAAVAQTVTLSVSLGGAVDTPSSTVLALPAPIGEASFYVTTTNSGIAGPLTAKVDTAGVPLPLTTTVCLVAAVAGPCTSAAAQSVAIPAASGSLTLKVSVSALASVPLDAVHHRVKVTFSDANGSVVGANSLAVQNAAYGRQVYINRGGTYSGNWTNDDINTGAVGTGGNAVMVDTTEPVVLENCFIRSSREFIHLREGGNLTVRNCRAYGVNPATAGATKGYFMFAPRAQSLRVEHNYVDNPGGGVALWSLLPDGAQAQISGPLLVRFNKFRNLDGVPSDGAGGRVTTINANAPTNGFVQLNQVQFNAGVEISWNEVVAEPGLSATTDIIDLWQARGTPAAPVDIHDNLFDGQYAPIPAAGNGIDPTNCPMGVPTCYNTYAAQVITMDGSTANGVSADTVDNTTAFVKIHDNTLVNTWGGIILGTGHDTEAYGNRIVSSGQLRDGTWVSAAYGAGVTVWDGYRQGPSMFYNNAVHDNVVGWRLERVDPAAPTVYVAPPLRNDYLFRDGGCPAGPPEACNNVSLPDPISTAAEDAERALWRQKVASNSVVVGPYEPADCLFDWAERQYASLFAPARQATQVSSPYAYRYYAGSNFYLGTSVDNGHVYYLNPPNELVDVGLLRDWLVTAGCQ
jgi:hypothetical protein